MHIRGDAILNIVDRYTKLGAATFLSERSSDATWKALVRFLVSTYIGLPDIISADEGPEFRSAEWKNVMTLAGIKFNLSGVETHNAINTGERYEKFLRTTFEKVRGERTGMSKEDILQTAVKACNDTAGPNGLVPILLVLGFMPRLPIAPLDLPN